MKQRGIEMALNIDIFIQSHADLQKSVNHACMNEHILQQIYLARSHIEMKQRGIEMALNIDIFIQSHADLQKSVNHACMNEH